MSVIPFAATALAAAFGFSDPVDVGKGEVGQTAGAIGRDGAAVLATARNGLPPRGESVRAWSRSASSAAWVGATLASGLGEARDVHAAVAPDGTVIVAWAEVSRSRQAVGYAVGRPGDTLRRTGSLPVGNGFAASPRLAVLASGAVVLAVRDAAPGRGSRLRVAVLRPRARRFGPARSVATGLASLALAAADDAAMVAWPSPSRGASAPRTLRARRLDRDGRPAGTILVVSRDSGATVRVAGSPGGRVLASWVRPALPAGRPAAAFTRSIAPDTAGETRPLSSPGIGFPRAPAALDIGDGDVALAALAGYVAGSTFGFRVGIGVAGYGATWRRQTLAGEPSAMVGQPRPLLVGGEQLVAFTRAIFVPGPATYEVVLARRARTGAPVELAVVDTGVVTSDGRGLVADRAGRRVLIAWPSAFGGFRLVERR